jgi:hypothetical protein
LTVHWKGRSATFTALEELLFHCDERIYLSLSPLETPTAWGTISADHGEQ